MANTITILERLARREKEAETKRAAPPLLSIDRVLEETRHEPEGLCVECGLVTYDEFYGVYLCSPYNHDGSLKEPDRRCKWIWRDGAGAVWKARKQ